MSASKRNNLSAIFNSLLQGSRKEGETRRRSFPDSSEDRTTTFSLKTNYFTANCFLYQTQNGAVSQGEGRACPTEGGQGSFPPSQLREGCFPERPLLAAPLKAEPFRVSRQELRSEIHEANASHSKAGAKRSNSAPFLPHNPQAHFQPQTAYAI